MHVWVISYYFDRIQALKYLIYGLFGPIVKSILTICNYLPIITLKSYYPSSIKHFHRIPYWLNLDHVSEQGCVEQK